MDAKRAKEAALKEANRPDVRVLTDKELQNKGRGPYRNKYFAGTLPWHRSLKDVNLCNGNLFKSFTDVQVAPAKGVGLALQRTYNSMDDRIVPFGQGWTHAYDIRIEEENPTTNQTDDTLNYVDRSDFFAGKRKYHRDADGAVLASALPLRRDRERLRQLPRERNDSDSHRPERAAIVLQLDEPRGATASPGARVARKSQTNNSYCTLLFGIDLELSGTRKIGRFG